MQLVDFSQASVLVVGDIMLDRYWSGSTGRISPEAPVPVVNIGRLLKIGLEEQQTLRLNLGGSGLPCYLDWFNGGR